MLNPWLAVGWGEVITMGGREKGPSSALGTRRSERSPPNARLAWDLDPRVYRGAEEPRGCCWEERRGHGLGELTCGHSGMWLVNKEKRATVVRPVAHGSSPQAHGTSKVAPMLADLVASKACVRRGLSPTMARARREALLWGCSARSWGRWSSWRWCNGKGRGRKLVVARADSIVQDCCVAVAKAKGHELWQCEYKRRWAVEKKEGHAMWLGMSFVILWVPCRDSRGWFYTLGTILQSCHIII